MRNVAIPHGYTHVCAVQGVDFVKQNGNRMVLDVHAWITATVTTYRFEAMLNQFVERDIERNHHNSVEPLILDNGDVVLIVDNFSLTLSQQGTVTYASISGILFTK